jgi:spore maturation protein CgeB
MRILCVFGRHNYGDPLRGEGYEFTNFVPAFRALGHEVSFFDSWDRSAYCDFADLNRAFLRRVDQEQPDIIFCVLLSYELWQETLDIVRSNGAAAIINWGTDDSWKYEQFSRFVAPHVDSYATTNPKALEKAHFDGLDNFVLTQWGANRDVLAKPLPAKQCKYPVTFVGSAYGNRRKWIDMLRARGIHIECFGHGWPAGPVSTADLLRLYRESVVTLNFGDSGIQFRGLLPYRSRQIKARVFEVPGAGGCLLTEPAQNLEDYFRIGEEILVFDGPDELAERIVYLLTNPEKRDVVAHRGFERVSKDHTYDQRFKELLEKQAQRVTQRSTRSIDWLSFEQVAHRHEVGPWCSLLRTLCVVCATLVWGKRRGPRAARRLTFELSWRLRGVWTYTAAGWPGRMFYRES